MPTIICPLIKSSFVRNSSPDTNFGGLNYCDLGLFPDGFGGIDFNRDWLQFDTNAVTPGNLPAGAIIDSAIIWVNAYSNKFTPPYDDLVFDAYVNVAGDFDPSTLTWNNAPSSDIYYAGSSAGSPTFNSYTWLSIDVTATVPNTFFFDLAETFYLKAHGENGDTTGETLLYIVNDPVGHPDLMPYIEVDYHLPSTGLLTINTSFM